MDGWWLRRWVLMTWMDIISNVLWVLLLGGLDEVVLRRGPIEMIPPSMSLHLMVDGEGDEVGKVSQGWGEGRCLRAARIIGGRGKDETTKTELDRSRIVEVGHDGLKMECRAEFQYELEILRLDNLKEEPPRVIRQEGSDRVSQIESVQVRPSQCSGPYLGVEPVMSKIVPPGVPRETRGKGASDIRLTPVFLGRVGVQCRVAQSCLVSFTSPTPVCGSPCPFSSTALSHGHGYLSHPLLRKNLCLVFTRPYCTAVSPTVVCTLACTWLCGWENPMFQDLASRLDVKN
ncbi:hypothetical protein GOBAR_AA04653 [Gossypium barbadense]|uniref:Uncharacterized protein n=1 Tax=Gossypium barbadense TaxID=3634 RepID=A0A2P5YJZ7_GOSBA|nr:hypothetical protein GOBAR_AA04653 [Gossypium barbadense]